MRLLRFRDQAVVLFYMLAPALALVESFPTPEPLTFSPIQRRQTQCPANYFSCEDEGPEFAGVCCGRGTICSLDGSGQAACCPTG